MITENSNNTTNHNDIINDFDSAEAELLESSNNLDQEFELNSFTINDTNQILILFDLAEEALVDPKNETKYTDIVTTRESKTLQSTFLEQQLKTVEKSMATGFISLKNNFISTEKNSEQTENIYPKLYTLSKFDNIKIWIFDLAIVSLLTLVASGLYLKNYQPYFWELLRSDFSFFKADIVALTSLILFTITPTTLVYYTVMLCGFGSTIGMDSVNAKAVHITGRELYFKEKLQRAILTTSTIITFHWVYALLKRKNYIEISTNSLTGSSY